MGAPRGKNLGAPCVFWLQVARDGQQRQDDQRPGEDAEGRGGDDPPHGFEAAGIRFVLVHHGALPAEISLTPTMAGNVRAGNLAGAKVVVRRLPTALSAFKAAQEGIRRPTLPGFASSISSEGLFLAPSALLPSTATASHGIWAIRSRASARVRARVPGSRPYWPPRRHRARPHWLPGWWRGCRSPQDRPACRRRSVPSAARPGR